MANAFKTIATFQYSTEAQIIKGRLESEGVAVFLSDHLTIDTDPLVSNAIGGVKLKVYSRDALKAQHILRSIKKQSLNNKDNTINCPNCKSEKVELFSTIKSLKSFFWFIFGALFSSPPFYKRTKYECEDCKTKFDLK